MISIYQIPTWQLFGYTAYYKLSDPVFEFGQRISPIVADAGLVEGIIHHSRLCLAYLSLLAESPALRSQVSVLMLPVQSIKDVCCFFNWTASIQCFFGKDSFEWPRKEGGDAIDYAEIFGFSADVCDALSFCQSYGISDLAFFSQVCDKIGSFALFSYEPIYLLFPCNPKAVCNLIAIGCSLYDVVKEGKCNLKSSLAVSIHVSRAVLIFGSIYLQAASYQVRLGLNILNFVLRHLELVNGLYLSSKEREERLSV